MINVSVTFPGRIESVANARWHWTRLASYHKVLRLQAWAYLRTVKTRAFLGPVMVTITRIAPRQMDGHDNLRSGCKGLVDGVADWLGVNDNDSRIEWAYAQERGATNTHLIRIDIKEASSA